MPAEYYIRPPDSETARGPYDIDKLITLAEAGQINRDTLYYDEIMESWVLIAANDLLKGQIFPDKKRLKLKSPSHSHLPNIEDDETEISDSVSVTNMLAAAEGETEETKHHKTELKWQHRTASISVPMIATVLIISGLSYIYPSLNLIQAVMEDSSIYMRLLYKPIVVIGTFDLLAGIALHLRAIEVYSFVRFRALFGAGFFGITYWANYINGSPVDLFLCISVIIFGIGLFISTITMNFRIMMVSLVLSYAGALGFAWFTNLQPLSTKIFGN